MQAREKSIACIFPVIAAIVPFLALLAHSVQGERGNPGIQTVFIPTRDGVSLATDLYFPFKPEKQLPAVLIRTPYSRRTYKEMGDYFSARGFVVAIQDVRGRPPSGGKWEPAIHEGDDGYDAVEWLAVQGWSNGKVGTVGASYDGWNQFLTALAKPPHLATIIPNVPDAGPFHNFPYEYGVFFTYGATFLA